MSNYRHDVRTLAYLAFDGVSYVGFLARDLDFELESLWRVMAAIVPVCGNPL